MSQFLNQPQWTKRIWDELEAMKSRLGKVVNLNGQVILGTGTDTVGELQATTYTDANRPSAASVPAGTVIFNSDDAGLNVSDGTDWRVPDGSGTT